MAELDKTGKKDDDATRQVRTEPAAEAIQRDASRAATATDKTSTTAEGAGRERFAGRPGIGDRMEGDTASGRMGGAVSDTFQSVGAAGGGAIDASRGVLRNVIEATEEVGTSLVGGVRNVAKEVVVGVGDVGETAVHTLTDLLVGLVGGVKTVVSEAMPRGGARSSRTYAEGEGGYRGARTESAAERAAAEEAVH